MEEKLNQAKKLASNVDQIRVKALKFFDLKGLSLKNMEVRTSCYSHSAMSEFLDFVKKEENLIAITFDKWAKMEHNRREEVDFRTFEGAIPSGPLTILFIDKRIAVKFTPSSDDDRGLAAWYRNEYGYWKYQEVLCSEVKRWLHSSKSGIIYLAIESDLLTCSKFII